MGGGASTEADPAAAGSGTAAADGGSSFSDIRDETSAQNDLKDSPSGTEGDDDDDDDGFAEMAAIAQAEAAKQRESLAQLPPTKVKQETKLFQLQMQVSLRDVSVTCFYLEDGDLGAKGEGTEVGNKTESTGRLRVEAVVIDTDEQFETSSEVTLAQDGFEGNVESLLRRGLCFDSETGELELRVLENEDEDEVDEQEEEEEEQQVKGQEEESREITAKEKDIDNELVDGAAPAGIIALGAVEAEGMQKVESVSEKAEQESGKSTAEGDDADSISDFSDSDDDTDDGDKLEENGGKERVDGNGEASEGDEEKGEQGLGKRKLWKGGGRVRFGKGTHHCMIAMLHRKENRTVIVQVHDIEVEGDRHEVQIPEAAFFGPGQEPRDESETIDLRECAQSVIKGLSLDSGGGGLSFRTEQDGTDDSLSSAHRVPDGLIYQAGRLIRKVHCELTS